MRSIKGLHNEVDIQTMRPIGKQVSEESFCAYCDITRRRCIGIYITFLVIQSPCHWSLPELVWNTLSGHPELFKLLNGYGHVVPLRFDSVGQRLILFFSANDSSSECVVHSTEVVQCILIILVQCSGVGEVHQRWPRRFA